MRERLRQRPFVASMLFTAMIGLAGVLVPSVRGDGTPADVPVAWVGPTAQAVVREAARYDGRIRPVRARDGQAARRAVRDGDVDAAMVGPRTLVSDGDPDGTVQVALRAAAARTGEVANPPGRARHGDGGPSTGWAVGTIAVVDVHTAAERDRRGRAAAVFGVSLVLFMQLFLYGSWISIGVIEEKSSRVVEVLLAAISPRRLLIGKVLGLMVLGLVQLAIVGALSAIVGTLVGTVTLDAETLSRVAVAVLWFLIGFPAIACLFAVAGALVSRQEDLQSTTLPLNIAFVLFIGVGVQALLVPYGPLTVVGSFLPVCSSLAMPIRMALGHVPLWEVIASLGINVAVMVVVIPVTASLYTRSVLQLGPRVRLRSVLRRA